MEGIPRKFPRMILESKKKTSKIITLIDRNTYVRSVKNHNSILQLQKKTFPQHHVRDYIIQKLEPSPYIQFFFESDILISPHGASLSNILFSRPGTGIIELKG